MISLSIIIPMYNVAPYVERCLRSLVNQDIPLERYEIICINDGSPDNCKEVVENLQKEIPNIVLIDQHNQGVSMARNNGIKIAKGSHIMAIDPDDYIQSNSLKKVFAQLEKFDPDCLILNMQKINSENEILWRTEFKGYTNQLFESLEPFHLTKGENQQMADPDRSVAMLFKKEIIEKYQIFYPKDVPFLEDGIFVSKYLSMAKNYLLVDGDFYWRTIREGSATNSDLFFSAKGRKGYFNGLDDLYRFLIKNKDRFDDQNKEALVRQMYVHFCILPLIAAIHTKKISIYNEQVRLLKTKMKIIYYNDLRNPYNIYAKALFLSPYLFLITYVVRTFSNILINKIK